MLALLAGCLSAEDIPRKVPLTMRNLFLSVEHDHEMLAKTKDGRHTLRLSPLTEALIIQDLNCEKGCELGDVLSAEALPVIVASSPAYVFSDEFAKIGFNVSLPWFEPSAKSTMNVGRSSCSSSSITPIELSTPLISFPFAESGLTLLPVVLRSRLRRDAEGGIGVLVEAGGLRPGVVTTPRARETVFTWLSSVRALDSILAAASELEKRGGREGRG